MENEINSIMGEIKSNPDFNIILMTVTGFGLFIVSIFLLQIGNVFTGSINYAEGLLGQFIGNKMFITADNTVSNYMSYIFLLQFLSILVSFISVFYLIIKFCFNFFKSLYENGLKAVDVLSQ